ncbi:MAG TPA: hypothetical protein VF665_02390 [Longimicrobium sp.]|uniref:hypothetical protein n=1 Tax=Longimicrobium sp. TaxID=2029185 RepID=UPI002ED8F09A
MTLPLRLPPDALARMVIDAATQAGAQGYWTGAHPIHDDAVRHMVRFLGLLLAGDDDLAASEIEVYGRVFEAVSGHRPAADELRAAAMESVELASDPDGLHAFLMETPAYLAAVLEMDRERGTRNADQVVTALSGLGVAILAADGHAAPEEDSIITTHLNHLRGELDRYGVTATDD